MWVPLSLVRPEDLFGFARLYLVLALFSSPCLKSSVIDGILALPSTLPYCALATSLLLIDWYTETPPLHLPLPYPLPILRFGCLKYTLGDSSFILSLRFRGEGGGSYSGYCISLLIGWSAA